MDKMSLLPKVAAMTVPYLLILAIQILTIFSFYYNYKFYSKVQKQEATTEEVKDLTRVYYGLLVTSLIVVVFTIVAVFGIMFKFRRFFEL